MPNFGILRKIGGCVALIGGYCEVQADCTIPDTICVDKKCQCKEKFIKKSLTECRECKYMSPKINIKNCFDTQK